jgi:hypothetical protein
MGRCPVGSETSSLTADSSPDAIDVCVLTHASTCQGGAPWEARDAYASAKVSWWKDVGVRVVAQERERQPARPDVLLGRPVVAAEREHRVRRRPDERRVDDVPGARGDRRVDEGPMMIDSVRRFGRRHPENDVRARQGPPHGVEIVIRRDGGRLGKGPGSVAHDQPSSVAEEPRDPPTQTPARRR